MPNWCSRSAALWLGLMWIPLLASCPSESPETPITPPTETAKPVEFLLSGGQLPVHIDATDLTNGDHYGAITITSPTDPPTSVEIPLLAHVSGRKPAGQEGQPPEDPLQVFRAAGHSDPLLQATTEPKWIKPPPEIAESGIEYEVEYTAKIGPRDESGGWLSVGFAEDADLTRSAKGTIRSLTGTQDTHRSSIRFETCSDGPVYVHLQVYGEKGYRKYAPVRVQVSHPTQALALIQQKAYGSSSTIEGVGTESLGSFEISSLCERKLTWKIATDAPWIRFSRDTGTIDSGKDAVEVTAVKNGLTPGNHSASLTVSAEGSDLKSVERVYFTLSGIKLQWVFDPPATVQSGETFLAQFKAVPGFRPSSTAVLANYTEGTYVGYPKETFPALPTPDALYLTPVRLIACGGAAYKLRAAGREPSNSYAHAEALPVRLTVQPAKQAVLKIMPLTLEFTADDTLNAVTQFLEIGQECGKTNAKISVTSNRPWIVLEDSGTHLDPKDPRTRLYWNAPPR